MIYLSRYVTSRSNLIVHILMQVRYLHHFSEALRIAFSLIQGVDIWSPFQPLNNDSLWRHLVQRNQHRYKTSTIVRTSTWQARHNNMFCWHDILLCIGLTWTGRQIFTMQTKCIDRSHQKCWKLGKSVIVINLSTNQIIRCADKLFVLTLLISIYLIT